MKIRMIHVLIGGLCIPLLGALQAEARGRVEDGFCFVYEKHAEAPLRQVESIKWQERDGVFWQFHENGALAESSWYDQGRLQGPQQIFSGRGRILKSAYFYAGQPHGLAEAFYPEGGLFSRRYFVFGRREGPAEFFTRSGRLQWRVLYEDDQAVRMDAF